MESSAGILAYGSLISDPGKEIRSATVETKGGVTTPFKVEYARSSTGRKGAPTLVPVTNGGARVRAKIFVVNVTEAEATDRLYRREINKVCSTKRYYVPSTPQQNDVIIKSLYKFEGIDAVLYTEIEATIGNPTAETLAKLAIASARELGDGRDGISYLITAKKNGINTPLSAAYEEEVIRQMQADSLDDALRRAREMVS